MKLAVKSIASVTLVTLLIGITPTRANTPSQLLLTEKSTDISQNQKNKRINVDFLAQAIINFWQEDRYLTESVLELTGKVENKDYQIKSTVKTIAQSGNKFYSEITFGSPEDQDRKKYVVVSNGKTVWIYQPDAKQYSTIGYQNFQETFLMGMSSVLFLSFPEDAKRLITQNVNEAQKFSEEMELVKNSQLEEENTVIDDESLTIYRYKDIGGGINLKALVNSDSALLKQIEFGGELEGTDMVIKEKIIQRTANPTITNQTFTFSPPPGVKKVRSLSISPF